MTLTEFLLARIAEDEAVALHSRTRPWDEIAFHDQAADDIPLIARYGPARVLAECEAKRRIVEDFEEYARDYHDAPSPYAEGRRHAALLAVTRAAAVYADHPDYRPEWRP